MISCAVYGCTNNTITTSDPTIQYYYFPKHPVIAQEWFDACCWRPDQIDVNTARICSIHFDNNSYTSEYKMLDYLGCYTKVLKYDAVPTLFLPNTTTALIIGNNSESPNSSVLPIAETSELKNFIVYSVQSEAEQQNKNIVMSIEQEKHLQQKYGHIKCVEQLLILKEKNEKMRQRINYLNSILEQTKQKAKKKLDELKAKEAEVLSLHQQYSKLYRNTLTLPEERNILSKVFSESQIKILSGKKKIYWSNDDMAVGYTIRHLSNKRCYTYLTKNLNIPLPALSSIKRWATLKKSEYSNKVNKKEQESETNNTESENNESNL